MLSLLPSCVLPLITDGRSYKLDSKWEPLETVEEATDKIFTPGMTATIGMHCYTADLKEWKKNFPPGSTEETAILLHEQLHAQRQLDYPGTIAIWLFRYITSPDFRWEEERRGYEIEIRYLQNHGLRIDVNNLAVIMSHNYKTFGGQMISYHDAVNWINGLIAKINAGQ